MKIENEFLISIGVWFITLNKKEKIKIQKQLKNIYNENHFYSSEEDLFRKLKINSKKIKEIDNICYLSLNGKIYEFIYDEIAIKKIIDMNIKENNKYIKILYFIIILLILIFIIK